MALDILHANDAPGCYPASWYAATAAPLPSQPPVTGNRQTEICIIGAGFTGLSAAIRLARAGRRVLLLDAHRIGWGASGRNGGQVSSGQRVNQLDLEAMFGLERAKWLWEMAEAAKSLVRDLVTEQGDDCEIVPGVIHANHRRRFTEESQRFAEVIADRYGYEQLHYLDDRKIRQFLSSPGYYSGVLDKGAFHLHPLKYAFALARLALRLGVEICERSQVMAWRPGADIQIETADATISADQILFACNGYLGGLENDAAAHVMPINNFIIATEPLGNGRAAELIPGNEAVADSRFVVNYFRRSVDGRLLFGGGEAYDYRFPADIAGLVRKKMLQVFPQLEGVGIDYAWGGTLAITRNRLPHFGRPAERIWSVSGYSGHGISISTLSGALAADAILGNSEDFSKMQQIASAPFPGGGHWRSPLLKLAMYWYALRDRL